MVNFSGKEILMELHIPQVFSYLQCLSYSSTNLDNFVIFYVDDVIIYSKTEQDNLSHVQKIFKEF